MIIGRDGRSDSGVVWLVSLDEGIGLFDVAAANAAEDLGKEVKSAFLGRVIWQGKAGIGLDDANGGEIG